MARFAKGCSSSILVGISSSFLFVFSFTTDHHRFGQYYLLKMPSLANALIFLFVLVLVLFKA